MSFISETNYSTYFPRNRNKIDTYIPYLLNPFKQTNNKTHFEYQKHYSVLFKLHLMVIHSILLWMISISIKILFTYLLFCLMDIVIEALRLSHEQEEEEKHFEKNYFFNNS